MIDCEILRVSVIGSQSRYTGSSKNSTLTYWRWCTESMRKTRYITNIISNSADYIVTQCLNNNINSSKITKKIIIKKILEIILRAHKILETILRARKILETILRARKILETILRAHKILETILRARKILRTILRPHKILETILRAHKI